jgi:hypothetical protein
MVCDDLFVILNTELVLLQARSIIAINDIKRLLFIYISL